MKTLLCTLLVSVVLSSSSQAGLIISFANSTGDAQADAGFQLAANYIQTQFDDNITITINRGFSNLGAGILGQAGSSALNVSYASWRSAIAADVLSANDTTFSSNLPNTSFSVYTNRTSNNGNSATPYVDSTGNNTTQVQMTSANARALGFNIGAGTDATITFSSAFTWDFNNTDGIDAGKQDFVGVAIHEIMHSMGFVSNVDDVDSGPNLSDDSYRVAGLDFTRFSTDSLLAGANIDFTADTRAKFFSIDGGATNLTPGVSGGWSTGVSFGDGRQASHWKDGLGIGIMDPTAQPAGNLNVVTNLDLMALDVIGWNRITAVPEPSSVLLCLAALLGCVRIRRRQS